MRITVFALVFLVALVLTGCAVKDPSPISRTEFVPQTDDTLCAEVWVEAPSLKGCRLEGDTAQDVVSLVHPRGKMALPDRVEYDGELTGISKVSVDKSGYVPVSVYHLIQKLNGLEIGYYKRKFARKGN